MNRSNDDPNRTDTASDGLVQRYREANALDGARPAPGLRDAVLAQARAQATKGAAQAPFEPPTVAAANDRTWTLRALGTLAALGLVGLLVLQFDQGTPEEREMAFGAPPAPSTTQADRSPARSGIATAPAPVKPPSVPRAPDAQTRAESAQDRASAADPKEAESSIKSLPELVPAPPPPSVPPAHRLERPAPEHGANTSVPESAARSRVASPMASQAPSPPASAEASGPTLQAAPGPLAASALLRAARVSDLASVREAIARGEDLNATDPSGRTALMTAAARGDLALVRLLLDAGADTALTDQEGLTAADLARQAGHDQVVDLL